MQIKFKGQREGNKISIIMTLPIEQERTVITVEMPSNGDWRADMECYDKMLSAYEERCRKALGA